MYNFNGQHNKLSSESIEKKMKTKCFGKKVVYYDEIDSTNSLAKELGKQVDTHGVLIVAEQQNIGRGRLGRSWSSPKGSGIWMTLVLKPQIHIEHAAMITLVTALAVNKGIRELTGLESFIKWPNDIVLNGKKVCGILTEMCTTNNKLEYLVIGMGINVSTESFSEDIKSTATSLQLEYGERIDRVDLIASIMKHLEQYFETFMQTETLKELVQEYNAALVNVNRQIRILEQAKEYEGIALGIDDSGALLVKTEKLENGIIKNTVKTVVAGEVSVRGIYGYV